MEIKRYRIVAIGVKQPDLLSKISQELTKFNYEIENISSLRLGHSIVIVCLIETSQDQESINNHLKYVVPHNDMKLIIDECTREKIKFIKSDAFMRIRGPHEAGSKAYIISELINAGLDIHGIESDTYEADGLQRFVMNIKGQAKDGIQDLSSSADKLIEQGLDVAVATNWELLV